MERRSFLQNTILGTLGASFFKTSLGSFNITNSSLTGAKCFMSESGIYGDDDTFVMGFLIVNNWEQNETLLENKRNDLGFRSVLTYRSNNRYKIDYTKSLIDIFSNSQDFTLYLHYSDISGNVDQIENKLSVINDYKIDLVNNLVSRMGQNAPLSVITKYQSLNGPSESFRSKFQDLTQMEHKMMVTRESNLLQFSSYLTSTAAAIINDKVNHPVKLELTNYFKNNLDVQSFDNEFSKNNIHFYK